MEYEIKIENEVMYIRIDGRLTTVDCDQLYQDIISKLTDEITEIVVDCGNMEYVVSSGLRIFLTLYRKIRARGTLKIINVTEYVMEILQMTGLDQMLEITEKAL